MRIKQDRPAEFYHFTRDVLKKNQAHPPLASTIVEDDKERGQKSRPTSSFYIKQRNLELKEMFEEVGVELVE